MNKYMKFGAALCASILLACPGMAEERHIGDLIYVPAMTVQMQSGTHVLRVEGHALEAGSDVPVVHEQLAGAEFGVYVFSSDGELTPWANPLYPSEPMRIRTREGDTRFSLPRGTEFYLRQESAPEGYAFDAEMLIPVTGEEICVRNAMAGELVISAVDTLGNPVPGAAFTVTDEFGAAQVLTADENGQAMLSCSASGLYKVSESALPEGVFGAISVNAVRSEDVAAQDEGGLTVQVSDAARTRIVFEHPASGGVQLNMQLAVIDIHGQTVYEPLAGVVMRIEGGADVTLETDAAGSAYASLLEGEYVVSFAYDGSAILPVETGRMIVESGATTVIDLTATMETGRILLVAEASKAVSGGSMLLTCDANGEEYGPYALDGEGIAVSDLLEPGVYYLKVQAPEHTQIGELTFGDTVAYGEEELVVEVTAGQVAQAGVNLLLEETQTFAILSAQVDERGEVVETPITGIDEFQLIGADGELLYDLESRDGYVTVEALTGEYTLCVDEREAEKLGVLAQSAPFNLPSQLDSIVFPSSSTRLILTSVDEHGRPVAGAVYSVTSADGKHHDIVTDEQGEAVTPLLLAGDVHITTEAAPAAHDAAPDMVVTAEAGSAVSVQIAHERHGVIRFALQLQKLDETGSAVLEALDAAAVEIYKADGDEKPEIVLTATEDGQAVCALNAGEYVAVLNPDDAGVRAGEGVRFVVANGSEQDIPLIGYDALGGLRVNLTGGELSEAELAQVRFELTDGDGQVHPLNRVGDAFFVGGLPAGAYTLSQTQMPQGYTLGKPREVTVIGGEAVSVAMPLEEYAVLTVNKTGLTFSDTMQTFVVPLTGQYALYTQEGGEMMPYPSEENQMTLWSNVTPEQIAQGMNVSVKLPAAVEGTTYYIREITAAAGFAQDDAYREIVLVAGEPCVLKSTVSSDRGFFTLDQVDAVIGVHVAGGTFELMDSAAKEPVLTFTMGEEAYRNPMAVPVGTYWLRQTKAAPGYALSEAGDVQITIEPYLTQGGYITQAVSSCAVIPQEKQIQVIRDLYAAREQGLTLVTVDTAALASGETLILPQMTMSVSAAGSERSDIRSVQLTGVGDDENHAYAARVEYCLADGGWQPSDARMSGMLDVPVSVSLADVEDDICAVRITYVNAETGEEMVHGGFRPGMVTLNVRVSAEGAVDMQADAAFTGSFAYKEMHNGPIETIERADSRSHTFATEGDGVFDTAPAGKDGGISGIAFFDTDGDGVADMDETSRYAGMNVSLLSAAGETVATERTDGQGAYSFGSLSAGTYTVQFEAGEDVVFSSGALYSEHVISSVVDTRYGRSAQITIDADHTDYVVNAGCLFASSLTGVVAEKIDDTQLNGFGGLSVEMSMVGADDEEEPVVVLTGDSGEFSIGGILPGRYEVRVQIPQDYLCSEAADGYVVREIEFTQGENKAFGVLTIERGARISGSVLVDADGDGVIPTDADPLGDVAVKLLDVKEGHTQVVAEARTDSDGQYAFEMLPSGMYSVLFELPETWAFTRHGEDSLVYGTAAASGSTENFAVLPGQNVSGIQAGVTIPASLNVFVFKDTQYDGQKGTYEEMLANASVSLIRVEGGVDVQKQTVVTGADGIAAFENVSPGEYVLGYQLPGAWRATKQVDGSTTNYPVSCVPQSSLSAGRSGVFTLSMGQRDATLHIGAMLSGSISGVMYYDDDADAQQSNAESGAAELLVELLDSEGDVLAQMNTDAVGAYSFEGLAPGRYRVRFTAPEACGFAATERTMTRGGVQESDSNVSMTKPISLASGETVSTADAGIVRLGALSGRIWEDSDADQVISSHEAFLTDVEVVLMNGSGRSILASTRTDENGQFAFESVRPGDYMLRVGAPDGYVFSGAEAGSLLPVSEVRERCAYSNAFTMLGGVHVEGIGFGLFTQGTISGLVWQDVDYSAQMNGEETGLRGAQLTLLDEQGNTVATQTSQRSGEYAFDGLTPGMYMLQVDLPEGYVFTKSEGASIVDAVGENTALIDLGTLAMGQTISGQMIGALKPAAVGGIVWMDSDDDGRRQHNDTGLQEIAVQLIHEQTGDFMQTYTDETGAYRFDGVLPGTYALSFELPEGHAFARNAAGTKRVSCVPMADALIGSTKAFDVVSDASLLDMDAGVVSVGTVSGAVWEDSEYDGWFDRDESGVDGATIELIDAKSGELISSAQSDAQGEYLIDFVRMGEYALRVTLPDGMIFTCSGESIIKALDDQEGTAASFALAMGESLDGMNVGAIVPANLTGRLYVDRNENGAEDADEPGLSGATVTMMQGGTVVAAAETDGDGVYAFDTLRPGTYRVRIALPEDTLFVREATLKLAHPDATEGETDSFELAMGDILAIEPYGAVQAASIGGRAWSDDNANGRMDIGEPALWGTTAELISVSNEGEASVVSAVEVEENGEYAFKLLRSGVYAVRFTLPEGRLFADCLGEADASSVAVVPGNTGVTETMTLAMGESHNTVNVGGILPGSIGDTIWLDTNGNGLQDYREPLIPDVSLSLMCVEGDGRLVTIEETVSDEYGYYRFRDLRPGMYVIRLGVTQDDELTHVFGAPLGEIDSDFDPETAQTDVISLMSGQTLRNIDAGFIDKAN